MKTVLFLCTGNYYRSRFAEGLFNHLAGQRKLTWRADSCGLAVGRTAAVNVGPISLFTLQALKQRNIPLAEPIRFPRLAAQEDFTAADVIIALKEAEHRPLMREYYPVWENRVTYWHVHDLDQATPEVALAEIDALVRAFIVGL